GTAGIPHESLAPAPSRGAALGTCHHGWMTVRHLKVVLRRGASGWSAFARGEPPVVLRSEWLHETRISPCRAAGSGPGAARPPGGGWAADCWARPYQRRGCRSGVVAAGERRDHTEDRCGFRGQYGCGDGFAGPRHTGVTAAWRVPHPRELHRLQATRERDD